MISPDDSEAALLSAVREAERAYYAADGPEKEAARVRYLAALRMFSEAVMESSRK